MQTMQIKSADEPNVEGSIRQRCCTVPVLSALVVVLVVIVGACSIILSKADDGGVLAPLLTSEGDDATTLPGDAAVGSGSEVSVGGHCHSVVIAAACKLRDGCDWVDDSCVAQPAVGAELPSGSDGSSSEAGSAAVDIPTVRSALTNYRAMLDKYYDSRKKGTAGPLVGALHLKPGSAEYSEGLDFIANKFARAFIHGDDFVIGAMGSSVTAGHDNCNYDSYERQLERSFGPVLESAGVKLVVRNAGERGECGDNYANQVWCVRNLVGDDADIIHYSWTYFENMDDQFSSKESLIRWSLLMNKSPAVHVINAGGGSGQTFKDCGAKLFPESSSVAKYAKYGTNVLCLETGLFQNGKYTGKNWGKVGDDVHTTTRYGEDKDVDDVRRKSLGVVFRNWHPGPLGFQIVADAFGYYYAEAALRALEMIEKKAADGEVVEKAWPKIPRLTLQSSLPTPDYCKIEDCGGNVEEPPGCVNFEKPTYGYASIKVLPMDDDMQEPVQGPCKSI